MVVVEAVVGADSLLRHPSFAMFAVKSGLMEELVLKYSIQYIRCTQRQDHTIPQRGQHIYVVCITEQDLEYIKRLLI